MAEVDQNNTPEVRGAVGVEQADPLKFFEEVKSVSEIACGASSHVDQFVKLADHTIRIRFATEQLYRILGRAFKHLESESSAHPDLTINVWDSAASNTQMPPPPWSNDDHLPRGEIRGFNNDRIRTAFTFGLTAGLSMLDNARGEALFWVRDAKAIPYFEMGAPLRTILYWWLSEHGYQVIHGGAVGLSNAGVLLVGAGGSGKSSSCLACLDSSLKFAGDDYCIVTTQPTPRVFSLYSSAKLKGISDLERFPYLAALAINLERLESEKPLFFLNEHFPQAIAREFPLRAILVPSIQKGTTTRVEHITPALGLAALAPSSIFQNAGASHTQFHALSRLVKLLPCYRLVVGGPVSDIPKTIIKLLSDLPLALEPQIVS